jgi:glutamate racemase
MPYGNKSEKVLKKLLEKNIEILFKQDCDLVIVACNTLSVRLVRIIQDELVLKKYPDRKVLGVVIPTIEVMLSLEKTNFLVLATVGTAASQRYEDEFKLHNNPKQVKSIAVSELAQLIEQGEVQQAELLITDIINQYKDFEVIVLACTHYVILKEYLRKTYSEKIILSQDEIINEKLYNYLERHPKIRKRLRCAITNV